MTACNPCKPTSGICFENEDVKKGLLELRTKFISERPENQRRPADGTFNRAFGFANKADRDAKRFSSHDLKLLSTAVNRDKWAYADSWAKTLLPVYQSETWYNHIPKCTCADG